MLPGITTYNQFTGNGVTRVWTYTFRSLSTTGADLRLFVEQISTGVITAINANYSVDYSNSQVTYPTVVSGLALLTSDQKLTIMRVEPITQLTDLVTHGSFDAEVLEATLDKLTAIAQQLQAQIDTGFSVSGVGPTGASGASGFSGVSGESNVSGWSGFSGESGVSGLDGASGFSGIDGASGWSGVSGASLVSGWSGFSGISGASGVSGESNVSGWSGVSGVSGFSGRSGASGQDGLSGVSGFSGDNPGSSGLSGTSGFSGLNGNSLVVPINGTYVNASGWIPVNHALGSQYNVVMVFDNNEYQIIPDEVVSTDADNTDICLASYGGSGIAGTWNIVIKY